MENMGKFVDIGYSGGLVAPGQKKSDKSYQRLTLDGAKFPYLSDEEIGEECEVCVKVKVVGNNLPDSYDKANGKKGNQISVELIAIAEPKEDDDSEEEITSAKGAKKTLGDGY